jgi:hypothetical protein
LRKRPCKRGAQPIRAAVPAYRHFVGKQETGAGQADMAGRHVEPARLHARQRRGRSFAGRQGIVPVAGGMGVAVDAVGHAQAEPQCLVLDLLGCARFHQIGRDRDPRLLPIGANRARIGKAPAAAILERTK